MADHGRFAPCVGADSARKNSLFYLKAEDYAVLRLSPVLDSPTRATALSNCDDGEEAHSSYRPWPVGRESLAHITIDAG